MAATIIDGKQVAAELRAELTAEVTGLRAQGVVPGLGVILVGEDPASNSYVKAKEKACADIGLFSDDNRLPADTSEEALIALVERMNADPAINGILVQLPLPKHINESAVIAAIAPEKDVDGFTPVNVGRLVIGEQCYLPCTPHGVVQLLARSGVEISGSHVVVVGRSNIVGNPVANMLLQKMEHANATVTICHTGTKDMANFTRQADILIVATGWPNTVTADMVKDGAVVIDVGVNRVGEKPSKKTPGKMVAVLEGDVDFDAVKEKASAITPVPGGVGPMTITMLMFNTLMSAKLAAGLA